MNIGSIVRSANAFLAAEVHIIGKRRWNKRGAMVTDRYQHVRHHEDVAAFAEWAADAGIPVIAVDNLPGAVPVDSADLPERCVLLFGQEGPGLSTGGAGGGIRVRRDHAVRLDALDQRVSGSGGRDVRVVPPLGLKPYAPAVIQAAPRTRQPRVASRASM